MKANYRDLYAELEELTDHDGFINSCLEIKESMLFYDRSVLLSAYTSGIESLISSCMFWACIESDLEAERCFEKIGVLIRDFPERLLTGDHPMDVQALMEEFLQFHGWLLAARVPILESVFRTYMSDSYSMDDDIDELLRLGQNVNTGDHDRVLEIVGKIGAMALRGARIAPIWFRISDSAYGSWLRTIRRAVDSFRYARHITFPFDSIERERQKRREENQRAVIDLKIFRELRRPFDDAEYEQSRDDEFDEQDSLLFSIITHEGEFGRRDLKKFKPHVDSMKTILLAILENEHLREDDSPGAGWAPCRVAQIFGYAKCKFAVRPLIDVVVHTSKTELLHRYALKALKDMGDMATEELVRYVENTRNATSCLALVELLERSPKSDRVFRAMAKVFRQVGWNQKKEVAANHLANYGDRRAIPLLKAALHDPGIRNASQRKKIESSLHKLMAATDAGGGIGEEVDTAVDRARKMRTRSSED